ncbi:OmpA family protein [Viscerimonas tarda]
MNKKFLSIVAVFIMSGALSAYSQDGAFTVASPQDEANLSAYKTAWAKNRFKDTWSITLGVGAQTVWGEDDRKVDFNRRVTVAPSLTIGKYFSPIWGFRLQLTGGTLHGFNDGQSGTYRKWNTGSKNYMGLGVTGTPGYPPAYHGTDGDPDFNTWDPQWNTMYPDAFASGDIAGGNGAAYYWVPGRDGANKSFYMQHVKYVAANFDFMFDFLTLIGHYDPRRAFEITPFAGASVGHVFPHLNNEFYDVVGVNAGLNARIRLTSKFDLNIEGNATAYPDDFDGQAGDNETLDLVTQAFVGITYKVGKSTWEVADPVNYELVQDLNQKINNLRAQLDAVVPCPECPVCPVLPESVGTFAADGTFVPNTENKISKFLPDPVFFRIDKSVIDASEWSKIEKAVDYLTKYPHANVIVTGYADRKTAYPDYNLRLSERRAKIVAKALTEKYGINPLRISINWEGDKIQPFEVNEWNRVVVFVIEE